MSVYSLVTDVTFTLTHTRLTALFSGTTQVSRYQKGKTNLDFTEARDSEWQWHQLGHMQVCTSFQTDNHVSTPPLNFYRPDVSKYVYNKCTAVHKVATPLRELTCHMGSHSVTCHPAEVTVPPLHQPNPVLDLSTPEGCKAELT